MKNDVEYCRECDFEVFFAKKKKCRDMTTPGSHEIQVMCRPLLLVLHLFHIKLHVI